MAHICYGDRIGNDLAGGSAGGVAMSLIDRFTSSSAPRATILIRFLVGAVFLSEGAQKLLFPESLGVGRFMKIGIPDPAFMAPFVGVIEIVFGALVMAGLLTRLSAIPLLVVISVAILTTKLPMLARAGFWATAHEARTDYCMFLGLLYLIISGGGALSADRLIRPRRPGAPR
jgi:putative oxidoreductase